MAKVDGPRKIIAQTVREQTYAQLKELIVKGHFQLNYRFDLNQLSKELGISKTPLGEAIRQLESEGLLVVKPRSGTYLNPLTLEDVTKAFEMRQVLEVGSASNVMRHITDQDLQSIRAIHRQMKELLENGQYQSIIDEFIELDKKLHMEIVGLSGLNMLSEMYDQINTLLMVSRVRKEFLPKDSEDTIHEHEAIIAALSDRDENTYRTAVQTHIQGAIQRLKTAIVD
ncbi:GntR family transcriptional regulator [Roseovarius aestuarii]|nr:GntR family transcriptional regulator [Roseovarius aestuarii]